MEKSNEGKSVWEMEQEIGKKFPWFIDPDAWSNDGCITPADQIRIDAESEELYKNIPHLNPKNRK